MPLVKRNPNAAFETTAAAETTPPQAATPAPAAAAAAAVAAPAPAPAPAPAVAASVDNPGKATPATVSTALTQARSGAVSTSVRKPSAPPPLEELKGLFPVDYDTFDRLKSGSGNIVDGQNNNLGTKIQMTVLSWQHTWDVSPGSNDAAAKEHVRYSDDGVTIKDSNQTVAEYLDHLREIGYPKANVKQKMVVVGVLNGAEKDTNLLGKTVQLSLSNQSMKTFDRMRFDAGIQVMMGKRQSAEGAENILVTAEPRSSNGNNYTLLICEEDK